MFNRLFNNKKKDGSERVTIKTILTALQEHNPLFQGHTGQSVSVGQILPDVFKETLAAVEEGALVQIRGEYDILSGFVLLPGRDTSAGENAGRAEGGFFNLFFAGRSDRVQRIYSTYTGSGKGALGWEALGSVIFCVQAGELVFYLAVESFLYEDVRYRLEKDPDFAEAAVRSAREGFTDFASASSEKSGSPDVLYRITKPLTFFFSRFFLPYERTIKGYPFTSRPVVLYKPAFYGTLVKKSGFWIVCQVTCNSVSFSFVLFFEKANKELFEARFNSAGVFARELLKSGLLFLRDVSGKSDISYKVVTTDTPPGYLAKDQNNFFLSTRCSLGKLRLPVYVIIPFAAVASLFSITGLDPGSDGTGTLPLILKLNWDLFELKFTSLLEGYKKQVPKNFPGKAYFPFYLLASLIPSRDLRLILQNYLLQKYQVDYIISLFRYAAPSGGVINFLHYTEEKKIEALLFKNTLSTWQSLSKQLMVCSATFEEFSARNSEVMFHLFRAYKDKSLQVSRKTGWCLELFYREMQEGQYEKVKALAKRNIPFSNILKLTGRELEVALYSVPGVVLARAFMFNEEHLEEIKSKISRSKAEVLADDVRFVREAYKRGELEPDLVIQAKYNLNGIALDHLQKLPRGIPKKEGDELFERIGQPDDADFLHTLYGVDEKESSYILLCNPDKNQRIRAHNIIFETGLVL